MQQALLCPFTECTKVLSVFNNASSIKLKHSEAIISLLSKIICWSLSSQGKVKYFTPIGSQWLGICLPAQLII